MQNTYENSYEESSSSEADIDLSLCSVFIGNIPYNVNEHKLREIFSAVGPVKQIKLIFDHETGKPKGFGFCEYVDEETAISAKRNLNGYEIRGRALRVDNACTERSRMVMKQFFYKPEEEGQPYGPPCDPTDAPEIISQTVASMPPERMLDLVKETKQSIVNNPEETREMFLQNPQLGYAMLQTMVALKIVTPQKALGMLHKPNDALPVLGVDAVSSAVNMDSGDSVFSHRGPIYWPGTQPSPSSSSASSSINANASSSFLSDTSQRAATTNLLPDTAPAANVPMPLSVDSQLQASSNNIEAVLNSTDEEKKALILQVMQLSEAQIEQLPAEKRAALNLLREQILKNRL